jgi:YHS domain-containing protein
MRSRSNQSTRLAKVGLEPAADLVAGYAPLMPSYRHYLRRAEVDALVAELNGRTADAGPQDPNVAVVVDPVCGMKVRAVSETCRDEFTKHPNRYSSEPVAGMTGTADR